MDKKRKTGRTVCLMGEQHYGRPAAPMARRRELNLKFLNHRIGGNTIRNLASRWQEDVLEKPRSFYVGDTESEIAPGQEVVERQSGRSFYS